MWFIKALWFEGLESAVLIVRIVCQADYIFMQDVVAKQ